MRKPLLTKTGKPLGPRPRYTNLSPQGQYVGLCRYCNSPFPIPPTGDDPSVQTRRTVCPGCGLALSVRVPRKAMRRAEPMRCPVDWCLPGTRPGITVPAIPASRLVPQQRALLTHWVPRLNHWRKPRATEAPLDGFPSVVLAEQLGFALRLGLPLDRAVLSVIGLEQHWLLSIHHSHRLLERVLAILVSTGLPDVAREPPPGSVYTYRHPRDGRPWEYRGRVLFPNQRIAATWTRIAPLSRDMSAHTAGYRALLERQARAMEPLRPWVLRLMRPIGGRDWQFDRGEVLGRWAHTPAWAVWQTCCGSARLDTTDAWLRHNECPGGIVEVD